MWKVLRSKNERSVFFWVFQKRLERVFVAQPFLLLPYLALHSVESRLQSRVTLPTTSRLCPIARHSCSDAGNMAHVALGFSGLLQRTIALFATELSQSHSICFREAGFLYGAT